jgi:hypothetical protein
MSETKYKIEKGIPAPRGRQERYSWSEMELFDSFAFTPQEYDKICWASAQARRRHGFKFRISRLKLRIWRICEICGATEPNENCQNCKKVTQ